MPYISIATFLVALAFLLTCIYIAKLILRISGLLTTVSKTFDQVERQLDRTILETEQLIVEVERAVTDAEGKLQATSGAFHSLENIGEAAAYASDALKEQVKMFGEDKQLPGMTPFVRSIQWGEYATSLIKSWERGKRVALSEESVK